MGLLFLTKFERRIIGGKLCSSALAAAYGLFAIFPLSRCRLLIGGITLGTSGDVLALANAIFFSVTAGSGSSVCVRQLRPLPRQPGSPFSSAPA